MSLPQQSEALQEPICHHSPLSCSSSTLWHELSLGGMSWVLTNSGEGKLLLEKLLLANPKSGGTSVGTIWPTVAWSL